MRAIGAVLTIAFVVGTSTSTVEASEEEGPARVVLPLESYEKLRPAAMKPPTSLTVVDGVRLRGSFEGGRLTLTLSGRSLGERPEVTLLSAIEGFSLRDCDGTAMVRRAGAGTVSLLPLAERFHAACGIEPEPAAGRLAFRAAPPVLFVDAQVADGRLERGDEDDEGASLTFFRTTQGHDVQPVTATGRYRITLLPDEVRFRYEIALHNPNRAPTSFVARLASGERVERAEPASGVEEGGTYRVEAPPGDSSLALEGRLSGDRFTPPLEASAQLVLVESHPLVKVELDGPSRRVGPQEVGVGTQYRGGQGFLLRGKESLRWRVSVAEALRTDDALVRQIDHRVYVGEDGRSLSEAELVVENQGAPDLKVAVEEPLYASAQGAPALLMPEKDGLRLPLEAGEQRLVVQHRGRVPRFFGVALCKLPLLTTPVEASAESVTLHLPSGWRPLAVRFGETWQVDLPGRAALLWLALLALLAERALAGLGLARRPRLALALALALAALSRPEAFVAVLSALGLCGVVWLAGRIPAGRPSLGRIAVGLTLVVGVVLFMGWRAVLNDYRGMAASGAGGIGSVYAMPSAWGWLTGGLFPAPSMLPDMAMYQRGYDLPSTSTGLANSPPPPVAKAVAPTYRGLPVRRPIPRGVRQIGLREESAARPRLFLLLVASVWVTALHAVLIFGAGLLLVRQRRDLGEGLRSAVERVAARNASPSPPREDAPAAPA